MSLKNFGGVLDFAIQLENDEASFVQDALDNTESKDCQDLLERFLRENKKNSKTLTRARQENVTEMILEPIQGLEAENYQLEKVDPGQLNKSEILQKLKEMEDRAESFYQQAAQRLKPVSDVASTFQRLAKKRRTRMQDLDGLT
ncbi:MAG: hypothetical protein R6U22_01840 [Desulfohalobiaceae bacterium]